MADINAAVKKGRAKLVHVYDSIGTKELDEAIRQTYTKEPRLFHTWGEVCRGHEEIKKSLIKNFTGCRLVNTSDELFYGGGDTAVSRGTWTLYQKANSRVHSKGADLLIFKKVDGHWYLQDDTYVSEAKSVQDELMAVLHAWSDALRNGDSEKAASYFTPDGTYMPDKHPVMTGRKAIAQGFKGTIKEFGVPSGGIVFHHDTECHEIGVGLATLRGSSVVPSKDGSVLYRTKYLLTFKRLDDGKWYIHHDLWCEPAV